MNARLANFRSMAVRLMALLLAVVLFTGAQWPQRVLVAISGPLSPAGQVPTEEEERHAPQETSKAAAPDRRHAIRVPGPARTGRVSLQALALSSSHPASFPRFILPDHESDYWNGIGAPLRC